MRSNFLSKCFASLAFALLLTSYLLEGQGFGPGSTNWSLPAGGHLDLGNAYSFNALQNPGTGGDNGSQAWSLFDIDGDQFPDLVIYKERLAGTYQVFGAGNFRYWEVHKGSATGFAATPATWQLPPGGRIAGGTNYSYDNLQDAGTGDTNGSEAWSLQDMNGDGKVDLIAYKERLSGNYGVFGAGSFRYWKVYLNSGNGFSSTATNWTLPNGGRIQGGTSFSYDALSDFGSGDSNGSQAWELADMNGDSRPDLVVYKERLGGKYEVFGAGNFRYWEVYLGQANGFAASPTNWTLPGGGLKDSGLDYSFNSLQNVGTGGDNGSQAWATLDINGDRIMDLVVYKERLSGTYAVFGAGNFRYWKAFLGSASSFSGTATNWTLPPGGHLDGGMAYSFNALANTGTGNDNGSQAWAAMDGNGDGILDLVVYKARLGGSYEVFGAGNFRYWQLFAGSSNGFASSPSNCELPVGGYIDQGISYSYNSLENGGSGNDNGSQAWALVDMNADSKTDLVVYKERLGGNYEVFGAGNFRYWEVYLNTHSASTNLSPGLGESMIAMWPQPAQQQVKLLNNSASVLNVALVDVQGRKLREFVLESELTISLEHLASGMYWVQYQSTDGKFGSRRLFKR